MSCLKQMYFTDSHIILNIKMFIKYTVMLHNQNYL